MVIQSYSEYLNIVIPFYQRFYSFYYHFLYCQECLRHYYNKFLAWQKNGYRDPEDMEYSDQSDII